MNDDPLKALRDIHVPDAIGWWPLAPGWYLVAALIITIIIGSSWLCYKWIKRRRLRQGLRQTLQTLIASFQHNPTSSETVAEIAVYLKRLVIMYYPRENAALTGDLWLQFLDKITASTDFTQGIGRQLTLAPYQKTLPDNSEALIKLIESTTWQLTKRKVRAI